MSEVKKSGHSHHQRGRFSGKIGYVLAVAGSAVGLGNIWRFPYLAAKYGGGMFLLVYICLLYTSPSPRDKRQSRMPSSA